MPRPTTALTVTASTKPPGRKRKSDALDGDISPSSTPQQSSASRSVPEFDDDDPRLDVCEHSCNQIRRKIRDTVDRGHMKVGEFQSAIGVSPAAYQRFMKQTGPRAGECSDVYLNAHRYFKKRELRGLKAVPPASEAPAAKKRKSSVGNTGGSIITSTGTGTGTGTGTANTTTAAAGRGSSSPNKDLDVSGVALPGEEDRAVKVHDTCDDVRRKIRSFLRKPDVTQAAFCREIAKSFPGGDRKVQSKQLNDFLGKSGPHAGNTSCVYYGSYVFFEKRRLKDGRPKSQTRLELEKIHPGGMNVSDVLVYGTARVGEMPVTDRYGQLSIVPVGARRTPYIPSASKF